MRNCAEAQHRVIPMATLAELSLASFGCHHAGLGDEAAHTVWNALWMVAVRYVFARGCVLPARPEFHEAWGSPNPGRTFAVRLRGDV